jgi:nucleoid-associated protein YgaU
MDITLPSIDYKKSTHLLLKEKTPLFVAGVGMFFLVAAPFIKMYATRTNTQLHESKSIRVENVKIYTVQAGDDLWKIAEKVYGSGYNAYDIAKANKLTEPFTLSENQMLVIPSIAAKTPTQGEVTEKAASIQKINEYIVQPGDFLWQIAEKVYGDGNQMGKLIEANNIPYPYNVEEGQKLIVP